MKRRQIGGGLLAVLLAALAAQAEARGGRRGCGSRGGPGYRKANGKCASHKD